MGYWIPEPTGPAPVAARVPPPAERESVKVRFRALVIALVILVVIDVVLRVPGLTLPIPDVYRLPSRTVLGYDQLVSSMTAQTTPASRLLATRSCGERR